MTTDEEPKLIAEIYRGNQVKHFNDCIEYDGVYDKVYSNGIIERWCGVNFIGLIKNDLEEQSR